MRTVDAPGLLPELTVALWVDTTTSSAQWLVTRGPDDGSVTDWGVRIDRSTETVQVYTNDALATSAYVGPLDGWHHLAFTFDPDAPFYRTKLFIDGELVSAVFGDASLPAEDERVSIGALPGVTPLVGVIDEVRLYSRALPESEIAGMARANAKDLIAWYQGVCVEDYKGNPACPDAGGLGNHQVAASADALPELGPPFLGGSYYGRMESMTFNGQTSLQAFDNPSMSIEDELSLAAWVLVDPALEGYIVRKADEYTLRAEKIEKLGTRIAGQIIGRDPVTNQIVACDPVMAVITVDGWHHVSLEYSPSKGAGLLRVDFLPRAFVECSVDVDGTDPLQLGYGLTGTISDVRVQRRLLDRADTARLVRTGYTVLSLPLGDAGALDLSAFGHEGTVEGTPQACAGRDGVSQSALCLDGVNDRILVGLGQMLELVEESFTISVWARFAEDADGWILAAGAGTGTSSYGLRVSAEGEELGCRAGDSTGTVTFTGFGDDQWHHIACTYDQSKGERHVYVDGSIVGPFNEAGESEEPDGDLVIGARGTADYLHADLDDVRIDRRPWTAAEVAEEAARSLGDRLGAWDFDTPYEREDKTAYDFDLEVPASAPTTVDSFQGTAMVSDGTDYQATDTSDRLSELSLGSAVSLWLRAPAGAAGGIVWLPGFNLFVNDRLTVYVHPGTVYTRLRYGAYNRWAHLVLSYDGDGGTLDFYLNGKRVQSPFMTGDLAVDPGALWILSDVPFYPYGAAGQIDQLQLFGRALTPTEARRLYTEAAPHWHWRFDVDARDEGPLGATGLFSGGAHLHSDGWQGSTLAVDGDGDWISVDHEPQFDLLSHQLTVSAWLKAEEGCDGYVLAKGDATTSPIRIAVTEDGGDVAVKVELYGETTATAAPTLVATGAQVPGEWLNVQVVFDAEDDGAWAVRLGDKSGAHWDAAGTLGEALRTSTDELTIGRSGGTGAVYAGGVDNLELFARALDEDELAQLRSSATLQLPLTSDLDDDSPFHRHVYASGTHSQSAAGLTFGADGYAVVSPDEMDDDYGFYFTISFEARVPEGDSGCFLYMGAPLLSSAPRVCLEGGHVVVHLAGKRYEHDGFDWSQHWDDPVGVKVLFGGDDLKMVVGGVAKSFVPATGYHRWDGGDIRLGGWPPEEGEPDPRWAFTIRHLTIERRWAE